ncbi:uncharacterized protein SPSK_10355 [Sporothrix schenckii 1099-18]|uniref:Uncharacterized protein n=1 Tax=Sporothrix schenckii 1099-18 TaxID=1397361 RepID=A0A0F2LW93_SPOSC|nr:uncharacterized protein SPSK_10355 [Sporothrix schenckii 1099-18]KJR81742.1 hypothetical protein SPSK_10355 [Sporothrix schenckii 1099-18]
MRSPVFWSLVQWLRSTEDGQPQDRQKQGVHRADGADWEAQQRIQQAKTTQDQRRGELETQQDRLSPQAAPGEAD